MNYYEELGIRSDADEEEIRKAHRRLVKLMHPDQHRDQGMKQLAETQMRRLNSIVATLLDPDERSEYDEQLRGAEAVGPATQQSTWRSVPWWIASTLGAIVLTVGAVWFFADRIGSGLGTPRNVPVIEDKTPDVTVVHRDPRPAEKPMPPPVALPTPAQPQGSNQADTTVVKVPAQEKPKQVELKLPPPQPPTPTKPIETVKVQPAQTVPTPKAEQAAAKLTRPPETQVPNPPKKIVEVAAVKVPATKLPDISKDMPKAVRPTVVDHSKPAAPIAPAAPSVPAKVADIKKTLKDIPVVTALPNHKEISALGPPPAATGPIAAGDNPLLDSHNVPPPPSLRDRDPLEGEWVYAPTEPEKHKPGLYPPEYIRLNLKKDTSGMRGEYTARYDIADNRQVSPDVNFVLKATDPKALKYVWTSADGTRGWLQIRSVESDMMRLEWKATSNAHGLSSGVATLIRKN